MRKVIFLLLVLAVAISACTKDFNAINSNPNAPTTVTPSLLLPKVQRDMMNTLLGETWGIGNIVIQHTAKNQFVNEDRYLWGEINSIWNGVYGNMRDLNNIIEISEASGQNNYLAVALILKSWMFSLATDAYGDIPYTEAVKAKSGINYPGYDPQEIVYEGILADLKKANDIIGTSPEGVAGDIIYNGNISKWKKLSNSLRIRALMRISKRKNVGADIASIINNPSATPVMESISDNAEYLYKSASPDQFPLHTTRIGSFNEFRASKTLLDTLVGLNDPRLTIFFRPTPATENSSNPVFIGIPNGMDDVTALTYAGGPQNHSRISTLYFEDAVNANGLKIAKGVIMTYSELQFILAEAAEKGLIGGDAGQYYQNGISASFAFYGLNVPAGYLDQTDVVYNGSSQQKLARIAHQKWISLFFQGMEAWFDWRRTGMPALQPAVDNQNDGKIPVRFIYPIIEQALNGPNRTEAVARMGGDNINTRMWIIQ